MAKRFSLKDDRFIFAYFDAAGGWNLGHDLDRSEASIVSRARKLKKNGGWAAIEKIEAAEKEYRLAMGCPCLSDIEDEDGV